MSSPSYSAIIKNANLNRQQRANALVDAYSLDPQVSANNTELAINAALRAEERRKQSELTEQNLMDERIEAESKFSTVDIGDTSANTALKDLLREQQKRVYNAKVLQKRGKISGEEALATIQDATDAIDKIQKTAIGTNVALDDYYKAMKIQPGQAGAVDAMTPNSVQQAMLGIRNGKSSFVYKNGELYAVRDNGDGEPFVANLSKVNTAIGNGDNFYKTVPDLTETYKNAYNNVVKPGGKDNADLVMFETKRIGDQEAQIKYMTSEQRNKAIQSMIKSGQFKGVIEDEERMSIIWSNVMGKDEPWGQAEGSPEEVEAKINKQKKEAALFLATKALEDNAPADGVKMVHSSSKYKPKTPGGKKDSKPPNLTDQRFDAKQAIYEDYVSKSHELVNDYDAIAEALTEVNPVDGTYTVVDDQYVVDSMDDELYDKYAEADEEEKKKILKEASGKIKVTIGETIIDEDGNTVAGLNSASGIKKALTKVHGISAEDQRIFDRRISERERRVKAEAQKAYDALEEKPAEDKEYFEYEGKRYKNPNYVRGRGKFDPSVGDGTKNNPHQGVAKTSEAVEGEYYVNTGMNNNSPDKGKVYQFKNGKYVEVK